MQVGGLFGTGMTPRNSRGGLDSLSLMDVWIFFWVCEISTPPEKGPQFGTFFWRRADFYATVEILFAH